MRDGRRVVAGLAALVALAAACSTTSTTPAVTTTRPPVDATATEPSVHVDADLVDEVVILGDSLTVLARLVLDDALPDAVIDATPGRTMVTRGISDTGISRLSGLPREPGRPWIIGLGTNDSGYNLLAEAQLHADFYRLLTEVGTDRCIAWILPFASWPLGEEEIANIARFADHIRETMEELPCGTFIDWPSIARTHEGLIDPDGVHLTAQGIDAFSLLILAQVDDWRTTAQ